MRATFMRTSMLLLGALAAWGTIGHSQGTPKSWLDEPKIASWNAAAQPIPAAPKLQEPGNPKCREQARQPQGDDEKQVRARGWDLVGGPQGSNDTRVVRGTASYDGMCRPMQYQDFVFVRGAFARTLAPKPMDSRTDGALSRVSLQSPTQLTGEYARYEKSDALCCPSRTTRVTFDIAGDPPIVRARPGATQPAGNAATSQTPTSKPAGLAGTSWQLVKFEGGDGAALTPSDRSRYTIEFGTGGQLSARVDCNRGRGAWTSDGASKIELGPLALTRAMCAKGSLHDQIVKQWGNIRSYVIRDGHLFLALMADGGIYEFEPMAKAK